MAGLRSWAREILVHRDVFQKKIKDISEVKEGLKIKYAGHEETVYVVKKLEEAPVEENAKVFLPNTKANFDYLIHNWPSLAKQQGLTLFFVNPDTDQEQKWIIRPNLHDRIADYDSLKPGLQALFSTVPEV